MARFYPETLEQRDYLTRVLDKPSMVSPELCERLTSLAYPFPFDILMIIVVASFLGQLRNSEKVTYDYTKSQKGEFAADAVVFEAYKAYLQMGKSHLSKVELALAGLCFRRKIIVHQTRANTLEKCDLITESLGADLTLDVPRNGFDTTVNVYLNNGKYYDYAEIR